MTEGRTSSGVRPSVVPVVPTVDERRVWTHTAAPITSPMALQNRATSRFDAVRTAEFASPC
ncbi:hypothetical protein BH23ACT6_BH23ACT6_06620 [soil metagenome]